MQVTIFAANCIGQAANCSYPNKVTVVTPEQLREAVKADHVCAEYKGNYRGIGNFIRSDVIVMDIDNDHSEEPAEWITAEKLEGIFPDMEYMLASSRHHLLPKEGKSARPRYHIYFPISEIADAEVYGNLKKALQKEYPFFDGNALDAARFIFGADCEEVLVHDGWMTIDEEIDVSQLAEEEDFDSEDSESASGGQILEGSRNNTMSRFAGRVLKRYGITEKAHEAFLEHAKKCDPPLPESELKTIWNSAVKFFKKSIVNQEGYVPPDEYNTDFESASLKPEDYSDIGQAKVLVREYGNELKYTSATDFLRFDGECWREDKKYKDPFSFVPSHTLVLYTNHLPKVGANDDGIWRRLVVIPFNAKITGKSDIKNYADYLFEHAGPAIMSWIIEGAKRAIDKNFHTTLPDVVEAAVQAYREENDWLGQFLEECCEIDPSYKEKSGELYQAYRAHCMQNGEYIRSTTDFYSSMDKAGYNRIRKNTGVQVVGLKLKEGQDFLE